MNRQQALEALGLSEGTLPEEIQQRFQELMEKYSPENASPSLRSEYAEKQRELTAAYGVLTPPAQDARSSAQPSDQQPSTARVVSEKTATDAPSHTQTASNPRVAANFDAILNMVPEATRNDLLQNAEGVQSWVRQQSDSKLAWLRQRNNAKLNRILREIDARMPRSRGIKPSSLRDQFVSDASHGIYNALKPHDILLAMALFLPPFALFGFVGSNTLLRGSATPFFLVSDLTFFAGVFFYVKALRQLGKLEGVFYSMVRQCVHGNLNVAKSTDNLKRIQELVSYSLLFIQDFGLDGEIEQVTVNESISESHSSGGYSTGRSISRKTGTINPRIINRLSRMVRYAHEALARRDLTDYERDKILDEFHLNLEQATETDPSQWTYQVVMGEALRWAQQQHRVAVRNEILAVIGSFVASIVIVPIILSAFMLGYQIVAHIAIPVLIIAAIAAYIKRDLLHEKITRWLGRRKIRLPQANPVQNDESNADNEL